MQLFISIAMLDIIAVVLKATFILGLGGRDPTPVEASPISAPLVSERVANSKTMNCADLQQLLGPVDLFSQAVWS